MPDETLRELILLAPIFEPGVQTTGNSAGIMMKKVPRLLDWDKEDVQRELQRMDNEGLVEPWDKEEYRNTWKSTPKGRGAREALARRLCQRAQCLCSPAEHDLDDLILALAASPEVCEREHAYPPSELRLADYLFDHKDELHESINRLEARGLLRLQKAPGQHSGKTLYITVDGVREYRKDVAARLGIPEGNCILDAQPRPVVANDALLRLGINADLVQNLSVRLEEAERCEGVEAYLAATVLYGSVLEGILEGLAQKNPREANSSCCAARARDGKPKKFAEWKFVEWIAVARDVDWIPRSVGGYANELRSARNLVHVSKQISDGVQADKHLARVTRSVLDAVLQHIRDRSP